jgi:hypothetical protein
VSVHVLVRVAILRAEQFAHEFGRQVLIGSALKRRKMARQRSVLKLVVKYIALVLQRQTTRNEENERVDGFFSSIAWRAGSFARCVALTRNRIIFETRNQRELHTSSNRSSASVRRVTVGSSASISS